MALVATHAISAARKHVPFSFFIRLAPQNTASAIKKDRVRFATMSWRMTSLIPCSASRAIEQARMVRSPTSRASGIAFTRGCGPFGVFGFGEPCPLPIGLIVPCPVLF